MSNLEIVLLSALVLCLFGWAYREGKRIMDVSLRRKKYNDLEKAYAKTRKNYAADRQALLESLGDAFFVTDRHGRIIMANAAAGRLMGNAGKVGGSVFHSLDHAALHDFYREIFKSTEPLSQQMTATIPVADGKSVQEFVIQVTSTPLKENMDHIGILLHDVTEEHRTQTVRRDFVANASHELRTPLTIIHGYLENLLEEAEIADDQAMRTRILMLMQKHTQRIMRIVEDMLVISKLEGAEAGKLNLEEFDLNECVNDVWTRLESMAKERQVELTVDIDPVPFMLNGDKYYWTQALFNLMENAIKQNLDPGLRLTVSARQKGDKAQIAVADNGIGIPSSHLPYIFNRFYRVESEHSAKIKGTGLGLSIVRRTIEAHGGSIEVLSKPGIETEFVITIPNVLSDRDEEASGENS